MDVPGHTEKAMKHTLLRWLSRLATVVWGLVLLILILAALYVVAGRQLMGSIESYRQTVESELSARLGQPVRINHLVGRWEGLDPELTVSGLSVLAPGDGASVVARVDQVNIRLDSLTSLARQRLVFSDLVASGLDLTLEQTSDGSVRLEGVSLAAAEDAQPDAGALDLQVWIERLGEVLSDPYVQLNQVRLGLAVPGEERRTFFIPQVDLSYEQGVFAASGRAMQPDANTQLASFYLEGKHFFRGDFDGTLFVDVDSGRLFDALIRRYQWEQRAIESFEAGGQGWLHFRGGRIISVNAQVAIPHLRFKSEGESRAPIEDLSAHVGWRRTDDAGWALAIRDMGWSWAGERASGIDLDLVRGDQWKARANRIPLGILSDMAQAIAPLDARITRALANYQPAGTLENAALTADTLRSFQLRANLDDVSISAYDGAPGAKGLDGHLEMTPDEGHVLVDSADAEVGFPQLFRAPWTLDRFKARVNWRIDGGRKWVWSDRIEMQYQGDTRIEGAFELELNDPGADTLSMRVESRNMTAPMIADFVPVHEVDQEFYQWLTGAVEEADIEQGVFYGHGQVNPGSPPGSFTTSMAYRFRDARIRYDDQWPEVTGASGRVEVQGAQADITLDAGVTGGLQLEPSRVQVDGDASPARLSVQTAAAFSGERVPYWLENSPLGGLAGDAVSGVSVAGDYHLDLGLGLALDDDDSTDADLDLALKVADGRVTYDSLDVAWEQINGALRYRSGSGFSGDALNARFLGRPVELSLVQDGGDAPLQVRQRGRFDVNDLAERVGMETLPGVEGRASYLATLGLGADGASMLGIESSLSNLSIDWPEPLGKAMGQPAPLSVIVSWGQEGGYQVSGHWEDRVAYRLRWQEGQLQRGRLELGTDSTSLSGEPGLEIIGHLPRVNVAEWSSAWDRHALSQRVGDAGVGSAPAWLQRIALTAGRVEAAGQGFDDVIVTARADQDDWLIWLGGPDVTGQVRLPADSRPISVDLDQLSLARENNTDADQDREEAASGFRERGVADWPDVDVNIDSVVLNDRDYGGWSFRVRPAAQALQLEDLHGQVGSLALDGNLIWSAGSADSPETTHVNGVLEGENLADLSDWIEGEVPLKNNKTRVDIDLQWPGGPDRASLKSVRGSLAFRLDDGVILERNNMAQIFRIFGVLNSDTLLRRLRLDFSDLYEAGVAFDAISGTANLRDGTLTLDPELQVVGPSGAFKITGTTDMIRETLDMRLVVVLPLTQNLPLAALLMGAAAPVGGALFVLDKVLGEPLSRLTSATYSVQGPWNDPQVDLRNVFDTGD